MAELNNQNDTTVKTLTRVANFNNQSKHDFQVVSGKEKKEWGTLMEGNKTPVID